MECKDCEYDKNGWCKKLETNNKNIKKERCPYNNNDKQTLILIRNLLESYENHFDLINELDKIINKF